jgi:hypothetical protein
MIGLIYIAVILYRVGLRSLTNVRQLFFTSSRLVVGLGLAVVGWQLTKLLAYKALRVTCHNKVHDSRSILDFSAAFYRN